jgi:hypothetical protein
MCDQLQCGRVAIRWVRKAIAAALRGSINGALGGKSWASGATHHEPTLCVMNTCEPREPADSTVCCTAVSACGRS